MAAHLHLAALAGTIDLQDMHHDLAMFYRELIRAAIVAD